MLAAIKWIGTIVMFVVGLFTGRKRREREKAVDAKLERIVNMFSGLSSQNTFNNNKVVDRLEIVLGVMGKLSDRGVDWHELLTRHLLKPDDDA